MEVSLFEKLILTYKYIAIFSTALFILKFTIFSLTSIEGSEISSDFTSISETDMSFDFFSIQSILSFLMGFGWVGLAALTQWKLPIYLVFIISVIIGFLFLFMSSYIMFKVKSLNQIINIDYNKCVGTIGKAYTTIHPNSEGQIQIELNGKLSIINATNATNTEIKAFEQIKVTKYENSKLYIEKE